MKSEEISGGGESLFGDLGGDLGAAAAAASATCESRRPAAFAISREGAETAAAPEGSFPKNSASVSVRIWGTALPREQKNTHTFSVSP